jgi:nicotinate-nucleotide pyrophosphorylase (carboxylating)
MCYDPPATELITSQVQQGLQEDLGTAGDLTASLLPATAHANAQLMTREPAILSGQPWFDRVYRCLDEQITIEWFAHDGDRIMPNQILCHIKGPLRALLTGERTAMNYLQTLSATATQARRYADVVADLPTRILDTRKTLPGLRLAQKYAVRCGGCYNHRYGLYDAILIKENHILAAGSIAAAMTAARQLATDVPIEIEVEQLDEFKQALAAGAQRILLDNFDLATLREAVAWNQGRTRLEASGGITLDNLRVIAETGVDDISVGALTKHVTAIDLSLRLV